MLLTDPSCPGNIVIPRVIVCMLSFTVVSTLDRVVDVMLWKCVVSLHFVVPVLSCLAIHTGIAISCFLVVFSGVL